MENLVIVVYIIVYKEVGGIVVVDDCLYVSYFSLDFVLFFYILVFVIYEVFVVGNVVSVKVFIWFIFIISGVVSNFVFWCSVFLVKWKIFFIL